MMQPLPPGAASPDRERLEQESASPDVRQLAGWILGSDDNRNMPFIIVDKLDAKVFVFHADGREVRRGRHSFTATSISSCWANWYSGLAV